MTPDPLDQKTLSILRRDARAQVSAIASTLGVARATVRTRIDRMETSGVISGYTITTSQDTAGSIRGILSIALEGSQIERVIKRLRTLDMVQSLHTTSGTWDIIVQFAVEDLQSLDLALVQLRQFEGVVKSETSIFLRSR